MSEIDKIRKRHDNALLEASYGPIVFETKESVMRDRATLLAKVDELQAQIDLLMLEYCPEEMTRKQKDNWAKHQVPVSPEEQAEIEAALEQL